MYSVKLQTFYCMYILCSSRSESLFYVESVSFFCELNKKKDEKSVFWI